LHGAPRLRAGRGTPGRACRRAPARRRHVRRSRAMALPPPAHRRRAGCTRNRGAAQPRGRGGSGPPAVAPRAAAGRRAHSLSRTTGPAVAVVSGAGPSPHVIFQPASTLSRSATRLALSPPPPVLALLL